MSAPSPKVLPVGCGYIFTLIKPHVGPGYFTLTGLVNVALPVARDPAGGPGHRLFGRVMPRRYEPRAGERFLGLVVPEPVLAGLEALHDRVPGGLPVRGAVLRGRGVAAAHVPALGAAAQVHPPAAGGVALDAAGPAGRHRWLDARYLSHWCAPSSLR